MYLDDFGASYDTSLVERVKTMADGGTEQWWTACGFLTNVFWEKTSVS